MRVTRLILMALLLLGAMTAAAFGASSGASPRAVDLPTIVTARPVVVATVATGKPATPGPAAAPPASRTVPSSAGSHPRATGNKPASSHPTAASGRQASGSKTADANTKVLHHAGNSDHEVVAPGLHESDGHDDPANGQGHKSGD